jgi:hypothetical protein
MSTNTSRITVTDSRVHPVAVSKDSPIKWSMTVDNELTVELSVYFRAAVCEFCSFPRVSLAFSLAFPPDCLSPFVASPRRLLAFVVACLCP